MKKKEIKKMIMNLKASKLTVDERYAMRSAIESHIKEHPPGEDAGKVSTWQNDYGRFFWLREFIAASSAQKVRVILRSAPVAIGVVLIIFSSLAYASQDALPGSALYGVKRATENIQSMIALDPREKANIQVMHAVERLKEAEILAESGNLDVGKKIAIEQYFLEDSNEAVRSIQRIRKSGDESAANNPGLQVELQSDFKSRLRAHGEAVGLISENQGDVETKASGENLARTVQFAISGIDEADDAAFAKASADKETALALKKIAEARIGRVQAEIAANTSVEAKKAALSTLAVSHNIFIEADRRLANGNYAEAERLFRRALSKAVEAGADLRSYSNLGVRAIKLKILQSEELQTRQTEERGDGGQVRGVSTFVEALYYDSEESEGLEYGGGESVNASTTESYDTAADASSTDAVLDDLPLPSLNGALDQAGGLIEAEEPLALR